MEKVRKYLNSIKPRHFWNSIFGNITLLVLAGIGVLAATVSIVVLAMSKRAFTETYGKSQEKVFDEIGDKFIDLNDKLQDIAAAIDTSWAFRLYFGDGGELDNIQNFQNIYQMERDLEQSKAAGLDRLNILVFGTNGKHYLSRTETISSTDAEILQSSAVQKAMDEPDILHYTFSKGAYTATSRNADVIVVSKALYYRESREVYAVMLVTLTGENIEEYYDFFVSGYSSFYMAGGDGIVMCSSDKGAAGKEITAGWYAEAVQRNPEERWLTDIDGNSYTVMKKELPYLGCTLYGLLDNNKALDNLYNMPLLVSVCVITGMFILVWCIVIARRTLDPLSQLVGKMSLARDGGFTQYMPLEGTVEVRELAATYNYMLDDIRGYIAQLLETQKERRRLEIKALQMQINPHYVYNTLASIKWLVYQNNQEKTVKTIDAFIQLLRNTISNTDEFITIEQELVNLHNYVLINQTRYGDAVQVEYYVSPSCNDCLLPKMILQPFIENAYFHAFPSGMKGTIQILIRQKEDTLEMKVVDDGVGMKQEKAAQAVAMDMSREHYSGIGVCNVDERLKLLYGSAYGIVMESSENRGTCVRITLPFQKMQNMEEPG